MAKDPKTGQPHPWNASPQRWIDGSVDNDLPMSKLSELFNVNHFIVSQVNPHIVPFLEKSSGIPNLVQQSKTAGTQVTSHQKEGSFKTTLKLAKGEIMHRLTMLSELGVFPVLCSKAQVSPVQGVLISALALSAL
jgi:TAG lipase / steryl ester hydrolase / phospholipase A2 / LPA acyltransferase